MPLKDFNCSRHGNFEAYVGPDDTSAKCHKCSTNCERVFLSAPSLSGEVRNHFNPHYDVQLGAWFETAEHKKKFLKRTGRTQASGPLSPRNTGKGNVVCNLKQAKQKLSPYVKT